MQVIALLVTRLFHLRRVRTSALLAGAVLVCFVPVLFADSPGTAPVVIVPADGKPNGIQLRSQTVEALLSSDGVRVWADTDVSMLLFNPGNALLVLPVELAGQQASAAPLPASLRVQVNQRPITLEPVVSEAANFPVGYSTQVTLPVRGKAEIQVQYRQELADGAGLVTFNYPLTATVLWAGRPESLRVTIRLDSTVAVGQLLDWVPAETARERDGFTWHWENQEAPASIGIALIAPTWWSDFETTRRETLAPGTGLAPSLKLAEDYWRIASLSPPFGRESYMDRYFPLAIGALISGLAASDNSPPSEIADAYLHLASLYLGRAASQSPPEDMPYLQQSAAMCAAALRSDPGNPDARRIAQEVEKKLGGRNGGSASQDAGNSLPVRVPPPEDGARQAQPTTTEETLSAAETALADGDLALARRLLIEGLGQDAIAPAPLTAPRVMQLVLEVSTRPNSRTFVLHAAGEPGTESSLLRQAARAVPGDAIAQASHGVLTVTLPYDNAESLHALQAAVAAELADYPELAMLCAALAPRSFEYAAGTGPLATWERYSEAVSLDQGRQIYEAHAARLDGAATSAAGGGGGADVRLRRLQGVLWGADAALWRALAQRSSATYRIEFETADADRVWKVSAESPVLLRADVTNWRLEAVRWLGAGAILMVLAVLYAISRAAP